MQDVIILGATGSIGDNTLEIIRQHREKINIKAIVAYANVEKLANIAKEFDVDTICIANELRANDLSERLSGNHEIIAGEPAILDWLAECASDVVISGIVGVAGLKYTIAASKNTKILGLANKESIVCGGKIFLSEIEKLGTKILPLDSEHNAIYQIFESDSPETIDSITLTASGGPFIGHTKEQLKNVELKQALKHPNWAMGAKNTIDSATLMNKGLEVIEACYLFNLPAQKVEVVVHPQSIVHGLVNYVDGTTLAHLSVPNMQVPISYALDYPNRLPINHKKLDLAKLAKLDFSAPDTEAFPLLQYAYDCYNAGVASLINLNMSNEIAVSALIDGKIQFHQMPEFVYQVLESMQGSSVVSIDDIVNLAAERKIKAGEILASFTS